MTRWNPSATSCGRPHRSAATNVVLVAHLVLAVREHVVTELPEPSQELVTRRVQILHLRHQLLRLLFLLDDRTRLLLVTDLVAQGRIDGRLLGRLVAGQLREDAMEQLIAIPQRRLLELGEQRADLVVVRLDQIDDISDVFPLVPLDTTDPVPPAS